MNIYINNEDRFISNFNILNFIQLKIFKTPSLKISNIRIFQILNELLNFNKLLYTMGFLILESNLNTVYYSPKLYFTYLPGKSLVEDFYRSNFMLKQSLIMIQCSRQTRHYQGSLGYY